MMGRILARIGQWLVDRYDDSRSEGDFSGWAEMTHYEQVGVCKMIDPVTGHVFEIPTFSRKDVAEAEG